MIITFTIASAFLYLNKLGIEDNLKAIYLLEHYLDLLHFCTTLNYSNLSLEGVILHGRSTQKDWILLF